MTALRKMNRIRKRAAKKGTSWCSKCDRAIVRPGSKCVVCHTLNGLRRDKKPAPMMEGRNA